MRTCWMHEDLWSRACARVYIYIPCQLARDYHAILGNAICILKQCDWNVRERLKGEEDCVYKMPVPLLLDSSVHTR